MGTYYTTRLIRFGYYTVFVCFMLLSGLCVSAACASSCSDYAATPPFLTASVKPNVVFMLDNSWSMKYPIYSGSNDYDPGKKYYGLFDSAKNYAYNDSIPVDTSSFDGHPATSDKPGAPYDVRDGSKEKKILIDTSAKGAFVEDTSSCTPGPGNNCWKGNFLNWMTTRRIDAARKVLVGGKVETRSGFDYLGNGGKTWKIVGNNEPVDDPNPIDKSYRSSQNQSPFPNGTTFRISSPAYSGQKKNLYDPYAKIEPRNVSLPFFLTDKSGKVIGEIGTIDNLNHNKKTIKLSKAYIDPVIVAKPPKFNDSGPATVRIEYNPADKTRFVLWIDEWEYLNANHSDETVTYMVLEKGTHSLPGTSEDMKVVAGYENISGNLNADVIDKNTNSWQTIDIDECQLAKVPVVIASVASINSPIAVTTRIKEVSENNFKIALQREERDVRVHPNETVHYIAMEPGLTAGSIRLKVGTDSGYTQNFKKLIFADISAKAFVADMQTTNDTEPASLRYKNFNPPTVSVDLKVEEELSKYSAPQPPPRNPKDNETLHGNETVGYIAVAPAIIYNLAVLSNSEPKGLLQNIAKKVRTGLSCYRYQRDSDIYIDGGANGGTLRLLIPNNPFVRDNAHINGYRQLDTHVKAATADIIDAVEHYPLIFGTTPLAENLYEVGRYFAQEKPHYDERPCIPSLKSPKNCETNYLRDKDWDPYFYKFNGENKEMGCANSFVIILTDGEPWADNDYLPDLTQTLGGIASDQLTRDLSGVAKSLYGDETTRTYRDLRLDMVGNQNIEISTIAFGQTYIPPILTRAAANANGKAYLAADGETLETALNSAITVIEKKTSTGGASLSLLSEKTTAGSMINQALLFPEKIFKDGTNNYKVDWTSTIKAFWFYNPFYNKNATEISDIRENTTYERKQDYALDIYEDRALDFRLDSNGSLTIDTYDIIPEDQANAGTPKITRKADGNPQPAQTYNTIDEVKKIFDIGKILKDRSDNQSPRKVYSIDKKDELVDFSQENFLEFVDQFKLPSSETSADIPACLGAVNVNSQTEAKQKKAVAKNLISYIRGASDNFTNQKNLTDNTNIKEQCRSRKVDSKGNLWKLGDIIYSTPRVVDHSSGTNKFSRLYTGANDGMLHAFKIGALKKGENKGQAVKLCDSNKSGDVSCTQTTIGKEAWTFIPKNALPYLKYLADPNYQHIYTVDLPPYLIQSGGKKILIGGMRFGGATGCTYTTADGRRVWCGDANQDGIIDTDADEAAIQTVPPGATPDSIATDNLGLSSYFALNITDPDDPKFLWEFTDTAMGFSFSGPAFITRKDHEGIEHKYIMFLSGPLSNKGGAGAGAGAEQGQDLKIFILKINPETFAIDKTFKIDGIGETSFTQAGEETPFTLVAALSGLNQAFGGRLFTNGIDSNDDGRTDVVFFGVNKLNPENNQWQGNVLLVAPTDDDPIVENSVKWEFGKVFDDLETPPPPPPITSRIGHGVCYHNNYIFFGSGRWFHKFDTPGEEGKNNYLWGIEIDKCLEALSDDDDKSICSSTLSSRTHNNPVITTVCPNPEDSSDKEISWRETLDGKDEVNGFLMERTISDPAFISNVALFTTTEPSSGGCDFGGRFRVWGFNCRTGASLFSECAITQPAGTLLLQGSGGNVKGARINQVTFSDEDKKFKATKWIPGIPAETGPTFVPDAGKLNGEIILWIER